MAHIFIVDDDSLICDSLSHAVRRLGHDVVCASSLAEARDLIRDAAPDLVFSDVRLPDGSGLEFLNEIHALPSQPEVIIMTGFGDPDGAELAIKQGAWDYVVKPLSLKDVVLTVDRALQYREKKLAAIRTVSLNREDIIGHCAQLRAALDMLATASVSDAHVLIAGETGTGKELFARALHQNSARAGHNFVVVDCAALPETLVESSLFGHIKGAFTGADQTRDGLIKHADGGTLFLDEIGEMSLSIQKAFLRVLQEKRFRPVGGSQEVRSDFRLVAATNRDLEAMVRRGSFREDLLFRVRTLLIELPPLRACRDDIKELTLHYAALLCEQYNSPLKGFSPDFFDVLASYSWPGNVRELIRALENAILTAQDESILFPKHLPAHIRVHLARASASGRKSGEESPDPNGSPSGGELETLEQVRDRGMGKIEEEYLRRLFRETAGNIREACRISGLSRSRLYTLLKKYRIPPSA